MPDGGARGGAPRPTARARGLVRGAYDLHVHAAPDVVARRSTDLEVAAAFRAAGLAGLVLKSHHVPTTERARTVAASVPGVEVFGSVTLNAAVGGVNPAAVEVAGRGGARVAWLPTVDAANQRSQPAVPGNLEPPAWAGLAGELARAGALPEPVAVLDGRGELLPETEAVLRSAARHGMTLATGHLGLEETAAVVAAAPRLGVRRVVVTHPEFTAQRFGVAAQRELAAAGAWLERCFVTAHAGRVTWDELAEVIAATGVEHSVLSSDLGQPHNPPVEDGLALLADRLLARGLPEEAVREMAVRNSARALGLAPDPRRRPGVTRRSG